MNNSRLLTIRRINKTPLFTISTFTIGNISGYLMESPLKTTTPYSEPLKPGFYSLAWTNFSNPKYSINFKEQVPLLFNNQLLSSKRKMIGHGNKPIDTIHNSMITGVYYRSGEMISSVKTLRKLTDHLHKVGIQNVTVVIL
jgi:hypothetical protein